MNRKFFKFEFVTENLTEDQANSLWQEIVKNVEINGFLTGIYKELSAEQLLELGKEEITTIQQFLEARKNN